MELHPDIGVQKKQKRKRRGIQIFRRLPKLNWQIGENRPFIPPDEQSKYPELVEDMKLLDQHLMPEFYELDSKALRLQNQFWLEQLALLVGSALAAILGAVQIAVIQSPIPGILETLVTVILAAITYRVQAYKAQRAYFTNRLAAETLRGEYYLFLGRIDAYADERNRRAVLARRVNAIVRQSHKGEKG